MAQFKGQLNLTRAIKGCWLSSLLKCTNRLRFQWQN